MERSGMRGGCPPRREPVEYPPPQHENQNPKQPTQNPKNPPQIPIIPVQTTRRGGHPSITYHPNTPTNNHKRNQRNPSFLWISGPRH